MTAASIPNRPLGTDRPRQIALLLADFDAITDFINNKNIDPTNLATTLNAKLGLNDATTRRGTATVAASQNTTSTTFADMGTVGPEVTVNVPANGMVAVFVKCDCRANGGGTANVHIDEFDGAATHNDLSIVAGTTNAAFVTNYSGGFNVTNLARAGFAIFPAIASGTRTYRLRYSRTGGTSADFQNRTIWVKAFDPA